ncbi:MAG: chromosomal replication initiator protein DnaA [Actinomycetota bacterium]|nr:chromosomal replication initiator protein DnaA [Actinomycetota bacterium]
MSDPQSLWKATSEHLRDQVSEATWRTWLAELLPVDVDDGVLILSAPSSPVRDRVEDRYLPVVAACASDAAGIPIRVRLMVRPAAAKRDEEIEPLRLVGSATTTGNGDDSDDVDELGGGRGASGTYARAAYAPRSNGQRDAVSLNPRYQFDAFVIGSSNRFAHAAAQRVAETPASSYNPLFVYGDSGLGKTHLLHAIGHYVIENFPGMYIRYVSTETFMNDFVDAIRTNNQATFKRRYRDCDVLLVDDIQFMEGKEGLQEEFFHTFNSLYDNSSQIVLSSDRHPRSIATLEDRLRSRFEWGLITDVQPPELETRLAILRKKAEGERMSGTIPDEVLELIATNVTDNIRELEGALVRVTAFASLNQEPLTRPMAERVLSDILAAGRPRQITPKLIMETTATMFGFSVDELCGTNRRRPLVNARQIGMYVFRDLTDFSYPAIAREFGGRDHTTVIHAVEKITGLMQERRQTYDQVTELIHKIKGGS